MKTTQEILQELNKKFKNLTLKGEYTGANNKILIKCLDCGYKWEAIPRSVIKSASGCPKCGLAKVKRDRAKNNFLNKLDTSKWEFVDYINPKEVVVKCKICGNVRHTTPNNIYRFGCKSCASKKTNESRKLSTEEFIARAVEIHKNTYDYSKVHYIDWNTPVIITCKKHGDFLQSPGKHLSGHGCPKCKGRNWTTLDFIDAAKEVHGDKYDYSETVLNKKDEEVCIICQEHGKFWQLPSVHIKMQCGCPKCSESHGERYISKLLDLAGIKYSREVIIENPYDKRNFRVDFFIKDAHNIYIIEFNGAQHYRPIELFGGEEAYTKQQLRDSNLREYCKVNNVLLLEIKYDLSESDIRKSIINFFSCRLSEKSLRELLDKIGEGCDANTEVISEIKKSETLLSVEIEPEKSE